MSERVSAVLPLACSGAMYAAVPRMTPAPVIIAGDVIVGDCDRSADRRVAGHRLGEAEIQHFHRPVWTQLDIGRLQIAMHDAVLVGRFERLGRSAARSAERLVEWNRALRNAIGERLAFDELQNERPHAIGLFEAVDGGDVGVVQRGKHFSLPLEARQAIGIVRPQIGQDFQRHLTMELAVRGPIDLAHPSGANEREDVVCAEASAGNQCHGVEVRGLYAPRRTTNCLSGSPRSWLARSNRL